MRVFVFASIALSLLAACSSTSSQGHAATHPAPAPHRGVGTMHVVLTAPAATTFDLTNATCQRAARGEIAGGLHVSAAGTGAVLAASIDDGRVGKDGTDDWTPARATATLGAPLNVRVALPEGAIFNGGAGSTAKLQTDDAGLTGTVVFSGATYAGKAGISDAAGTITWTCT